MARANCPFLQCLIERNFKGSKITHRLFFICGFKPCLLLFGSSNTRFYFLFFRTTFIHHFFFSAKDSGQTFFAVCIYFELTSQSLLLSYEPQFINKNASRKFRKGGQMGANGNIGMVHQNHILTLFQELYYNVVTV